MDDTQTPRALIEQLIDNNPSELCVNRSHKTDSIEDTPHVESVRPRRSPRGQSNKRSHSETQGAPKMIKKHKNVMNDSDNTITPRSTIQAFLQGNDNIEQTSKRSHKEVRASPGRKRASLSTSQISLSSRKSDLRKKATVKHLLKSQSFSSGPTPRGLIEGFIAGGEESTPVVKERSDADLVNSTGLDEIIFSHRRNVSTLGESYYLPSTAPESSTRDQRVQRSSPRLRKQFDLNEFAQEAADKIDRMRETNKSTRDMSEITEVLPQPDVSSFTNKTRELDRLASSKRLSVEEKETDLSLISVTQNTASHHATRQSSPTSTGSALKRFGVQTSEKTPPASTLSSEIRSSRRQSAASQVLDAGDRGSLTSTRRSAASISPVTSTRRSAAFSSPSAVTSLNTTTDTQQTTVGRSHNAKANFKDQLLTGTIQEVVANIVPVSDSSVASVSQLPADAAGSSTRRSLRSTRRVSSFSEKNKTSAIMSPDESRPRRPSSVSTNHIVQDGDQDESAEPPGEEDDVEGGHEGEADETDSDAEQMEEEEEEGEVDHEGREESDSDQEGSSDEQDKENLPDTEPPEQDHFLSSIGNVPHTGTRAGKAPLTAETVGVSDTTPLTGHTQAKAPPKRSKRVGQKKNNFPHLPLSLTKGIFSQFSQAKVNREVMQEVESVAETFWKNTVEDLSQYAHHANRTTMQYSDIELLMKRQGFVTEKQSLHTLVRKWMPLEYRSQLIPVASSKNMVYPREGGKTK